MNSCLTCVAVVFAILVFVKNGVGLQCWDCTSENYGRCADHFNTTLFPRISLAYAASMGTPRIINCGIGPAQYGQYDYSRHVCMKKVETNRRFQTTRYTRVCHLLTPGEEVGTCPTRTVNNDVTVDFCEYCDTPECNGASSLKRNFWIGLIPIAVVLALLWSLIL